MRKAISWPIFYCKGHFTDYTDNILVFITRVTGIYADKTVMQKEHEQFQHFNETPGEEEPHQSDIGRNTVTA
jgi:hypothetical protein